MKFFYPVIITKKAENAYHAEFPDLAMCEADADNFEDVLENARDAAYNWIDVEMHEDNPELPPSSDKADLEQTVDSSTQTVREILVTYRMMDGWEE